MAVVCGPRSDLQDINNRTELLKKSERVMPMAEFCADVARYRLARGRKFKFKIQKHRIFGKTAESTVLSSHKEVVWNITAMHRRGMKDPGSGLPYKKSVCFLQNFNDGSLDPHLLRCRTTNGQSHAKHEGVEGYCKGYGRRSALSLVYPFSFCCRACHMRSRASESHQASKNR